ncbi:hypothetical protein NDU88_000321 [Pleurodeles waltl]|uniref:Uncharacterized protein n=1 Tax=Pleurodeles waltl TaxID=8319 RepID=A0AAV7TEJ8_PLEWA|nr:hypothetical protein NDU88_000321 [Pleurodeles waltl]
MRWLTLPGLGVHLRGGAVHFRQRRRDEYLNGIERVCIRLKLCTGGLIFFAGVLGELRYVDFKINECLSIVTQWGVPLAELWALIIVVTQGWDAKAFIRVGSEARRNSLLSRVLRRVVVLEWFFLLFFPGIGGHLIAAEEFMWKRNRRRDHLEVVGSVAVSLLYLPFLFYR